MTQADHAAHHGQEIAARHEHVFQLKRFPKTGTANGMNRSPSFWKDAARTTAYRQTQSQDLLERGTAAEMQKEAARQKMLNTAFELLNAGCDISTFANYVAARKAHVGRIASISGLWKKLVRQLGSYDNFLKEVAENNHKVLWVEPLDVQEVYDVEVRNPGCVGCTTRQAVLEREGARQKSRAR